MSTVRDVAREAGVSLATVSHVFSGKGRVSDQTRRRVLEVAARLGYAPALSGPEAPAQGSLGILFPYVYVDDNLPGEQPNWFVADVMMGIEREAQAAGFQVFVAGCPAAPSAQEVPLIIRRRQLDGLLVVGGLFHPTFIAALKELAVPLITVGTAHPTLEVDAVLADNRGGSRKAVNHLLTTGRSRIALVNGPPSSPTSVDKLVGYREALAEAGQPVDEELIVTGDFSVRSGYEAGLALLETARPDGIFAADDAMALGVLRALRDKGVEVPAQVGVVGFGDYAVSPHVDPPLSTVRVFKDRMGALAARRLIDRIGGRVEEVVRLEVSTQMVVRASCGALAMQTSP